MSKLCARTLAIGVACVLAGACASAQTLRIQGSSIVMPPVAEAMKTLKKERGFEVEMTSMGGAQAGLASLGGGAPRIALLARHIQPDDRAANPELKLTEYPAACQVAALCVSVDVWSSGVRQLDAEQMRGIYEGRIKNWKELGGADQAITFFNWDEGYGMWELLSEWLYQNVNRAPKGKYETVGSNEEARNALEFTRGSIGLMSPKLAREGFIYALGLALQGKTVSPTVENVVSGAYPLTRPLSIIIDDQPTGSVKIALDYLLGPEGQKCFERLGFFSALELKGTASGAQ